MKNKKGFTLVELLAVIAILAILVIIALPNIMGMFNSAKESTFITELKKIYRGAEEKYVKDSFNSSGAKIYSKCSGCTNELDMQVRDDLEYYIEVNSSGKIVKYYAHDNSYQFSYDGEMTINDIDNIKNISNLNEDEKIKISSSGATSIGKEKIVCKRAKTLHSEICTSGFYSSGRYNGYCKAAGYTSNGSKATTTITYGSIGTNGVLNPGDAFDCDVNSDGIYNPETERFYYVSPKDGDNSSDTVVLIYYANVANGIEDNITKYAYGDIFCDGPNVGYLQLPTTSQWNNKYLKNNFERQIKTISGGTIIDHDSGIYNLPIFVYNNRAARFLTYQEFRSGCNNGNITTNGDLDKCIFFMENTSFANSEKASGFWLENWSSSVYYVYGTNGFVRRVSSIDVPTNSNTVGIRPAIELKKNNLEY